MPSLEQFQEIRETSIQSLQSLLKNIRALEKKHSISLSKERSRLNKLRSQLEHREFAIAVVGRFRAGKSTFINAVVASDDSEATPASSVNCTLVPVKVSWGLKAETRVYFTKCPLNDEEFVSKNKSALEGVFSNGQKGCLLYTSPSPRD